MGETVSLGLNLWIKHLDVNEKTITRYIKNIPNIQYVGKGKNGH